MNGGLAMLIAALVAFGIMFLVIGFSSKQREEQNAWCEDKGGRIIETRYGVHCVREEIFL